MRFRGTMSRKGVEVWTMDSDDALKLLIASNDEMGRRRKDGGGPCDGGRDISRRRGDTYPRQ